MTDKFKPMDNEQLIFCDICGSEILCDDEIGDIEKSSYILNGKRIKSRTVWCVYCYEERKEIEKDSQL